jgi:hypothetical protein
VIVVRDNCWLESKLNEIWKDYFSDIDPINPVKIKYGRRAKCRLGSIKLLRDQTSLISINSLLKDCNIPEFIVSVTIAHELVHYGHGFSSLHKRKYKKPHQGGVVTNELIKRGLGHELTQQKNWLKDNWINYLKKNYPDLLVARKRKRRKKLIRIIF